MEEWNKFYGTDSVGADVLRAEVPSREACWLPAPRTRLVAARVSLLSVLDVTPPSALMLTCGLWDRVRPCTGTGRQAARQPLTQRGLEGRVYTTML